MPGANPTANGGLQLVQDVRDYGRVLEAAGTRRVGRVLQRSRLGPAFVAAIAYVDPGNIATNTTAGAKYGLGLLWVVLLAVLMAAPVQYLAAKIGVVTGSSLPVLVGERLGPAGRLAYWVQAQGVTIATDLAETVGAAVAMRLLWGVPLIWGAVIAGFVGGAVLMIRDRLGRRFLEFVSVLGLVAIGAGFLLGVVGGGGWAGLDPTPQLRDQPMLLLAVGIVGATVMPHAIYLHSALTTGTPHARTEPIRHRLRHTKVDVMSAMTFAGVVNISMLLLGALALRGRQDDDLGVLANALAQRVGEGARLGLLLALLVSGLTATAIGTQTGEVVTSGLLHRRMPVLLQRAITLAPAIGLLLTGLSAVQLLIVSQVALALGLPFALIPLVVLSSSRSLMGSHASSRGIAVLSWAIVLLVVTLDTGLLVLTVTGAG